jgi:hypothetical protein
MSTIGGTITQGVTLSGSGSYASPLTIMATGAVLEAAFNPAIFDATNDPATVVNFGILKATGGGDPDGIRLLGGGNITNAASGYIFGNDEGIDTLGVGTVANFGTISGIERGVDLETGGGVANSNLISGTIYGVRIGIGDNPYTLSSQTGLVTNSGTIAAGKYGLGLELASGGSIGNSGTIVAGSFGVRIGNNSYNGLLATQPGTVTNAATITATARNGVGVEFGSGGTITNSALISSSSAGNAVVLSAGGAVLNLSTGTISAASGYGVKVLGTVPASVANYGQIIGPSGGVILYPGGLISNRGYLSSAFTQRGAIVENYGVIGGSNRTGIGLGEVGGPAGTVINSGTVSGAAYGINLHAGGQVGNSGLVSSPFVGVLIGGASATVTNSGTITGGTYGVVLASPGTLTNSGRIAGGQTAVSFSGSSDRLIVDPGAGFAGRVDGGHGTLELAAGPSTGTLSGLGTSFVNFGTVAIDSGAVWQFTGAGTLAGAGSLLVNAGTLMVGSLTVVGAVRNTGVIDLLPGTLDLERGASGTGAIVFTAVNETLWIGQPGQPHTLANPIVGFRSGDTIDVAGIVANGFSYAGGVLILKRGLTAVARLTLATTPAAASASFGLASDGSGGTSVTLLSPRNGISSTHLSASVTSPTSETTLLSDPGPLWHARSG